MQLLAEYSLWWLLPIVALSVFISWYFLWKSKSVIDLPKGIRNTVFVLRFIGLSVLGILLLGLLFEYIRLEKEKPVLLTVIDNSASMRNYKDSAQVAKQIKAVQEALQKEAGDRFEIKTYLSGANFREGQQPDFQDVKTNLSQGFEQIFSDYYNRNVGGVVLISDGNFNEGQHPVYAAAKLPFTPVFTLGSGDTTARKDQLVKEVISNEVAFLKNRFPIEVDLEAYRMAGRNTTVSILKKGKVLATQTVNYASGNYDSKQLMFELEATEPGFQQYTVELRGEEGEYTLRNNRRSFYIEVLDSRNKILVLSGAPHPDISALKSVLETDENLQVVTALLDKWDQNLQHTDLIIWHEPGVGFSDVVNQKILNSKIPVLYFVGLNTSSLVSQKLNIGLQYQGGNQGDEVQAGVSLGFDLFELSDELKQAIEKWPPVVSRFGAPKLGNQNKVFLQQRLVNIRKNDPLMYFGSDNNRKYGVFLGDGIWRWKQDNYLKARSHELFQELFRKTGQYLVQRINSSNLRVTLPKRFLKNEEVQIKAEFYNEAMELITKPEISFTLIDQKGKKSAYQFGVNGNLYLLPLGKLKPGTYAWSANTSFAGKKYSKSGNFVVEDLQIEQLDTRANHGALQLIANETNGAYLPLSQYAEMMKKIRNRPDITTVAHQESKFDSLLDEWIFLVLLLAVFGTEWFLKRLYGSY